MKPSVGVGRVYEGVATTLLLASLNESDFGESSLPAAGLLKG